MDYTSATTLEKGMRCHTQFFGSAGAEITTDVDAAMGGQGQFPTPGELLAATVASCMLSMVAYTGAIKGFDPAGANIQAACGEGEQGIGSLMLDITIPTPTTPQQRKLIEAAIANCPVGNSLHPRIAKHITWHWAD